MDQVTIYSEQEVAALEKIYADRAWASRLILYSFSTVLEDAILAVYPLFALFEIAENMQLSLPTESKGAVPLSAARRVLIEEVEELSEESANRRHAFFDMVETALEDIPRDEWPLIYLDEVLAENAYYNAAANVIVFSSQWIDEGELEPETLEFIINHEVGHFVLNHGERILTILTYKMLAVASTGLFMTALPHIATTGVLVGAGFNYLFHMTSVECEFEADEYAVTKCKTADGAQKFFQYIFSKYGTVYNRFIEEGFTEEQAIRLASACEQASFTHPSDWERIKRAEEIVRSLKERNIVQIEAAA